jgi:ZIP family zinc transporter
MLGFLGSLAAGSMTAIGAIPVLFGRVPSRATRDLSLGFAAGVMLAASFFSLIIPALDAAELRYVNEARTGSYCVYCDPPRDGCRGTYERETPA